MQIADKETDFVPEILISLQPKLICFWFIKLWVLLDQVIKVWNIKGWKGIWIRKYEFKTCSPFLETTMNIYSLNLFGF